MGTLGSEWGLDTVSNTYTCYCKGRCSGGGSGGGGGGGGIYCIDTIDEEGYVFNECYDNCQDLHIATGAGIIGESSAGSCESNEAGENCCEGYRKTEYGIWTGSTYFFTCSYSCAWKYCGDYLYDYSDGAEFNFCGWDTYTG